MKYKNVEKNVLRVYRKVSPSVINFDSNPELDAFYTRRLKIFKTLGIPTQLFKGKTVIDIGGGTGEKSLLYALWGANVTIVEPNEKSCAYAESLFSQFGLQNHLKIINKSFFEFNAAKFKEYDIVICEGVLHHTADALGALNKISKNLKAGSIFMLAIGESHGFFKRTLQRKLVHSLAGTDEDKIVGVSRKYFKEHIARAVKYGLRPENTVIYDTYVVPQFQPVPLERICNAFRKNKVVYVSAYPKLDFFYLTNTWSHKMEDPYNYQFYKDYYKFLEKIWMTSGEENLAGDLKGFDVQGMKQRVERDALQLERLEEKIENGTFKDRDLDPIRKGYVGVGLSYFVGMKSSAQNTLKSLKKTS